MISISILLTMSLLERLSPESRKRLAEIREILILSKKLGLESGEYNLETLQTLDLVRQQMPNSYARQRGIEPNPWT